MAIPNLNPFYKDLLKEEPAAQTEQTLLGNRPIPVIEQINMTEIFGTTVSRGPLPFYDLRKPFVEVARLIVLHDWDADTHSFEEFSGDIPLADGIQITIGEVPLFPNKITINEDYMRYAYDVRVMVDTKPATKHTHLMARLTFGKFMGLEGRGINLTKDRLRVTVGDDLNTGAGGPTDYGEISWVFEGWTWGT